MSLAFFDKDNAEDHFRFSMAWIDFFAISKSLWLKYFDLILIDEDAFLTNSGLLFGIKKVNLVSFFLVILAGFFIISFTSFLSILDSIFALHFIMWFAWNFAWF